MTARNRCVVWALISLVFGGALGFTFSGFLQADRRAEQAEQDRLQASQELVEEVTQILGRCELPQGLSDEVSYMEWLSDYLREHSDREVEAAPQTEFGRPDILIDNALAIELKLELEEKADQDRCVGQCIGYAQGWNTMLIVIDVPRRDRERLDTLLNGYRSEEIPIIELSTGNP